VCVAGSVYNGRVSVDLSVRLSVCLSHHSACAPRWIKEISPRAELNSSHGHVRVFRWERSQRRGVVVSGVRRMNEVNARRVRLVPGWVTVFGRVYHLGM